MIACLNNPLLPITMVSKTPLSPRKAEPRTRQTISAVEVANHVGLEEGRFRTRDQESGSRSNSSQRPVCNVVIIKLFVRQTVFVVVPVHLFCA